VRSLKLRKDLLSGDCKGVATIAMEAQEAHAAFAGLDGRKLNGIAIRVGLQWASNRREDWAAD
jgi:hypothetical protein